MRFCDEIGALFIDAEVAPRFPPRGRPVASPWQPALVCVRHSVERLSDRQAADAVRAAHHDGVGKYRIRDGVIVLHRIHPRVPVQWSLPWNGLAVHEAA